MVLKTWANQSKARSSPQIWMGSQEKTRGEGRAWKSYAIDIKCAL